MKTIVCYGDSNTWGYIPKEAKPDIESARYSESQRWTGILQRYLGADFKVEEEGLNGRTTAFDDPFDASLNGLHYIRCCMATKAPADLVIVMLGTNDMKRYLGGDAFNSSRGIEQIVQTIRAGQYGRGGKAPEILVVSPAKLRENIRETWPYGEFGPGCLERQKGMEKYYREVAQRNNCWFLDADEYVCASARDGAHLEPEAHEKLAEAMKKKVLEILK